MKCSCEAAFSVVVTPRHLAAKAAGVRVGWVVKLPYPSIEGRGQTRVYEKGMTVTPARGRERVSASRSTRLTPGSTLGCPGLTDGHRRTTETTESQGFPSILAENLPLHVDQRLEQNSCVLLGHELLLGTDDLNFGEEVERDVAVIKLIVDRGMPQDRL